jgi:hypothetical protein
MSETDGAVLELESASRLTKDIKRAAATLSTAEARYLVDTYYAMQGNRIRADNQVRAMQQTEEPHATLSWLSDNAGLLERNVKAALDAYGNAHLVGRWSKSIVGIGPVISAGLIANIDLEPWRCTAERGPREKACTEAAPHGPGCGRRRTETAGSIWRFAGLDPTVAWGKGEKRPWNASLKTLCWKAGESWVKTSAKEDDVYGHLYLQRKAYEIERNDAGLLAEQAAAKLEKFNIGKGTDAYKAYAAGRLPPAHLHARAKRWAVKIFISHWHQVAYRDKFGTMPPKPYILTREGGHAHEIVCPNWPF